MRALSFASWCEWRLSEIRCRLAERNERFHRRLIAAESRDMRTRAAHEIWSQASAELRARVDVGAVA